MMRSGILKVLLISCNYFYPPIDGVTVRHYNLFRNFPNGFRFDLLTFGDSEFQRDQTGLAMQLGSSFEKVTIVPSYTLKKIQFIKGFGRVKNLFFPHRLSMRGYYYSEEMANIVNKTIASSEYDLVFFCDITMYLYLERNFEKSCFIVDAVDSPSVLFESYLRESKAFKDRIVGYGNYVWAKRYEKLFYSKIRNIIFVSPIDRDRVKTSCPKSNVWIVPNGVDTEYFKARCLEPPTNESLLFTGVMNYRPNYESAIYFISEIFPLVLRYKPDITLTVVGKDPPLQLQALAGHFPNVKLTGFVDDIRGCFDRSTIYISPLTSGAGMKNKILEAWAMSKPVVATSISCAGLDARDGENILIANDPKTFSEMIRKLLTDRNLKVKLATNGRETAEKCYSWKNRADVLEKIFVEVINKYRKGDQLKQPSF
jgi:glycosyltransferase involved in cell wall biosynthesis